MTRSQDALMQEVAEGKHLGIEGRAVRYLLDRVPSGSETRDELESLVREFAVESAYEYQDHRCQFSTFLYRSVCWKAAKWLRSKANTVRIYPETDCGSQIVGSNGRCEQTLRAQELLDSLTDTSKTIFTLLLKNADGYAMSAKVLGCRKVSQLTGHPVTSCRRFIEEVRSKKEEYV